MYLLDTNVVSELRRVRPHGAVLAWLEGVEDEQLFVSAVTVGEIQAGIEITREQDAVRRPRSRRGWSRWRGRSTSCPWMRERSVRGRG